MRCELYNSSTESIIVVHNSIMTRLQPCTSMEISTIDDQVCLELFHTNNKKFNTIWYIMNVIFTLEQMRTVLVVDGTYVIRSSREKTFVRINDREYVFEKNTAYQTFVFNTKEGYITRKALSIANRESISRKAKFLYLFGGKKTLLPLSGAMLIAGLIGAASSNGPTSFSCTLAVLASLIFIWSLVQYIRSLNFLNRAMEEESIQCYLSSQRKECRKVTDDLVQKYMDQNTEDELFE